MGSPKSTLQVGDSIEALQQLTRRKQQLVYADLRAGHGMRRPLWGIEGGFQLSLFGPPSRQPEPIRVDSIASRLARASSPLLKKLGTVVFDVDLASVAVVRTAVDRVLPDRFRGEIIVARSGATDSPDATTLSALLVFSGAPNALWERAYGLLSQLDPPPSYRYTEQGSGRVYALGDCVAPKASSSGFAYQWNGIRRHWRWPEDRMTDLLGQGRLIHTASGMPRVKRYWDEARRELSSSLKQRAPDASRVLSHLLTYLDAGSDPVVGLECTDATWPTAAVSIQRDWLMVVESFRAAAHVRLELQRRLGPQVSRACDYAAPATLRDIRSLAIRDPEEFRYWALFALGATFYPALRSRTLGFDAKLSLPQFPVPFAVVIRSCEPTAKEVERVRSSLRREGLCRALLIVPDLLAQPKLPYITVVTAKQLFTGEWLCALPQSAPKRAKAGLHGQYRLGEVASGRNYWPR